ncbi:MAG: hypothetical protein C4576_16490 [Desulfobacteraceae bacterium]|nr:MAG: hypothetical protein C4576_16490 [Desulfobacteraceae bacterium]
MPSISSYRVLFLRLLEDISFFKERMSELGVRPEVAERIVLKAPVVMKAGIPLEHARRYAEAVQRAGGDVSIQEEKPRPLYVKPLEYFTMCNECGHKQPRKEERCVRCGHPLSPWKGGNEGDRRS